MYHEGKELTGLEAILFWSMIGACMWLILLHGIGIL
jgi:hypothetical protein